MFYPTCHILHVLSYMSYLTCHILHVLSYLIYPTCTILHVISYMSYPTCPILHVLSYMSYPTCPILHVLLGCSPLLRRNTLRSCHGKIHLLKDVAQRVLRNTHIPPLVLVDGLWLGELSLYYALLYVGCVHISIDMLADKQRYYLLIVGSVKGFHLQIILEVYKFVCSSVWMYII